jgi:hypothetical protein
MYYVPIETWYLRTIIHKSHRLSSLDTSSSPPQHTAPEDVFYILKAVLSRAVSLGDKEGLRKICSVVKDAIEKDFTGVIKAQLEDVYATSGPGGMRAPIGSGGKNAEKIEKENRRTFMVSDSHVLSRAGGWLLPE